eukprot:TRINITY_DN10697_c0_g1_i1.p1 TRINITY_DN10697_c0_g1~~TRINITY_DN10697_c0_g1_i1.p1  ORF type:complete len:352 (+),score=87.69 TRINITY_DN10697_c0_g1_i1:78-1133(+)
MGNCLSDVPGDIKARSKDIDHSLSSYSKEVKHEQKLLLLGPGESGKSTVVKQLRICYTKGFEEDELLSFKPTIHSNTLTSMSALVRSLSPEQIADFSEENMRNFELLDSPELLTKSELTAEITQAIKTLWATQVVRDRFENRSDIQIIDSARYYFNEIDRISAPNFVPTPQDVLFSRVRTTGINEICFKIGGMPLRLVDVGGQRSERRKWIHCFNDVNAIFFIVALNEYDQKLREDHTVNRMDEAIRLFCEICNYPDFASTNVILFLNKSDLFEEKFHNKNSQMKKFFPDFEGSSTQEGVSFIGQKFLECNKTRKEVFPHVTTATNTENIKFVFEVLEKSMINKVIGDLGI